MKVITRFAPSPTGALHIGGARTALFNWLFARHHGGKFLLRIEDTDRERSTSQAIDAIHDALGWLGLEGDAPAIMQSERAARHTEVAQELLASGAAYRCHMSDAELDDVRKRAMAEGRPVRSPWRDGGRTGDGPSVVRIRMPDDGETTIDDKVQGSVTVKHETLDDMVILRADGTPTYMLAVVVDDHDMGVTHVIRGDDHLSNAFRQIMVYRGMGWDVPVHAHIPLIHDADGAKMSKRRDSSGVDYYRTMGILPEALFNYLLHLGWSHGDDEIISRENAVSWFGLDKVGKSPSRFNMDKLLDTNAHYLVHELSDERLWELIEGHIDPTSDMAKARVVALMPLLRKRAKTYRDIAGSIDYLIHDDYRLLKTQIEKQIEAKARDVLDRLTEDLPPTPWKRDTLQTFVDGWLDSQGLKMKDIGPPLRAALTGNMQSPAIIDVAAALGPDEVLLRIRNACQK